MGNFCSRHKVYPRVYSIINPGLPHISEYIFGHLEDADLLRCRSVSKVWKLMCSHVIYIRWRVDFLTPFRTGQVGIVNVLLDHSIAHLKSPSGFTPLMVACQEGQLTILKILLAQTDIDLNAQDKLGLTAFMWACRRGHYWVVDLFLKECPVDSLRITPPIVRPQTTRLNVNAKDFQGETAFMMACQFNHKYIVQRLLEPYSKIFFDDTDNYGLTGIVKACLADNDEVINTILYFKQENYNSDWVIDNYLTIPYKNRLFSPTINYYLTRHRNNSDYSTLRRKANIRRHKLPAIYYS